MKTQSIIYLPNGGRIEIQIPWHMKVVEGGVMNLYTYTDQAFLGSVTPAGLVNISADCPHIYYPPATPTVEEAYSIVMQKFMFLSGEAAKNLKLLLSKYNIQRKGWRK